jgi:hypothetical protein
MYTVTVKLRGEDQVILDVDDEQASLPNYSAQLGSWFESQGKVVESIRLDKTEEHDV